MQDYSRSAPVHKTPHRVIGFVYIIPLGLAIGFLLFAAVKVWSRVTSDFSGASLSPTPQRQQILQKSDKAPSVTLLPTPEESVKRRDISVYILNGSGVTGAAGKVADLLREKGYAKVTTGNADTYTYTAVTIRAGAKNKKLAEQVKIDLEGDYTITKVEEADMTAASDVEVIVGKEKL